MSRSTQYTHSLQALYLSVIVPSVFSCQDLHSTPTVCRPCTSVSLFPLCSHVKIYTVHPQSVGHVPQCHCSLCVLMSRSTQYTHCLQALYLSVIVPSVFSCQDLHSTPTVCRPCTSVSLFPLCSHVKIYTVHPQSVGPVPQCHCSLCILMSRSTQYTHCLQALYLSVIVPSVFSCQDLHSTPTVCRPCTSVSLFPLCSHVKIYTVHPLSVGPVPQCHCSLCVLMSRSTQYTHSLQALYLSVIVPSVFSCQDLHSTPTVCRPCTSVSLFPLYSHVKIYTVHPQSVGPVPQCHCSLCVLMSRSTQYTHCLQALYLSVIVPSVFSCQDLHSTPTVCRPCTSVSLFPLCSHVKIYTVHPQSVGPVPQCHCSLCILMSRSTQYTHSLQALYLSVIVPSVFSCQDLHSTPTVCRPCTSVSLFPLCSHVKIYTVHPQSVGPVPQCHCSRCVLMSRSTQYTHCLQALYLSVIVPSVFSCQDLHSTPTVCRPCTSVSLFPLCSHVKIYTVHPLSVGPVPQCHCSLMSRSTQYTHCLQALYLSVIVPSVFSCQDLHSTPTVCRPCTSVSLFPLCSHVKIYTVHPLSVGPVPQCHCSLCVLMSRSTQYTHCLQALYLSVIVPSVFSCQDLHSTPTVCRPCNSVSLFPLCSHVKIYTVHPLSVGPVSQCHCSLCVLMSRSTQYTHCLQALYLSVIVPSVFSCQDLHNTPTVCRPCTSVSLFPLCSHVKIYTVHPQSVGPVPQCHCSLCVLMSRSTQYTHSLQALYLSVIVPSVFSCQDLHSTPTVCRPCTSMSLFPLCSHVKIYTVHPQSVGPVPQCHCSRCVLMSRSTQYTHSLQALYLSVIVPAVFSCQDLHSTPTVCRPCTSVSLFPLCSHVKIYTVHPQSVGPVPQCHCSLCVLMSRSTQYTHSLQALYLSVIVPSVFSCQDLHSTPTVCRPCTSMSLFPLCSHVKIYTVHPQSVGPVPQCHCSLCILMSRSTQYTHSLQALYLSVIVPAVFSCQDLHSTPTVCRPCTSVSLFPLCSHVKIYTVHPQSVGPVPQCHCSLCVLMSRSTQYTHSLQALYLNVIVPSVFSCQDLHSTPTVCRPCTSVSLFPLCSHVKIYTVHPQSVGPVPQCHCSRCVLMSRSTQYTHSLQALYLSVIVPAVFSCQDLHSTPTVCRPCTSVSLFPLCSHVKIYTVHPQSVGPVPQCHCSLCVLMSRSTQYTHCLQALYLSVIVPSVFSCQDLHSTPTVCRPCTSVSLFPLCSHVKIYTVHPQSVGPVPQCHCSLCVLMSRSTQYTHSLQALYLSVIVPSVFSCQDLHSTPTVCRPCTSVSLFPLYSHVKIYTVHPQSVGPVPQCHCSLCVLMSRSTQYTHSLQALYLSVIVPAVFSCQDLHSTPTVCRPCTSVSLFPLCSHVKIYTVHPQSVGPVPQCHCSLCVLMSRSTQYTHSLQALYLSVIVPSVFSCQDLHSTPTVCRPCTSVSLFPLCSGLY